MELGHQLRRFWKRWIAPSPNDIVECTYCGITGLRHSFLKKNVLHFCCERHFEEWWSARQM